MSSAAIKPSLFSVHFVVTAPVTGHDLVIFETTSNTAADWGALRRLAKWLFSVDGISATVPQRGRAKSFRHSFGGWSRLLAGDCCAGYTAGTLYVSRDRLHEDVADFVEVVRVASVLAPGASATVTVMVHHTGDRA